MDPNFLMLIDLDIELLIEEVMGGHPTSFIVVASVVLDERGRIADIDFIVEDDPPLKASGDKRVRAPVIHMPNL